MGDSHAPLPDVATFASGLTTNGSRGRAVKQLHALLASIDPRGPTEGRIASLEQLGRWVCAGPKPPPADDSTPNEPRATTRLRLLVRALDGEAARERLSSCVATALRETSALRLLCEVGLPNDRGLWDETSDRLARRFLPTPPDHADLAALVARMFRAERDAEWLAGLPSELVEHLFARLGDPWEPLRECTDDAIKLLTTRVSALGLSEDIRYRGPSHHVRDSPFFQLPHATQEELPVLIEACRREMRVVHEGLERSGVSVDVVYRVDVIAKCLDRIEDILQAISPTEASISAETRFVAGLVRERLREASVRDVVRANMRLLARKVIERAGETGEHYITVSRREWTLMLLSASGGGFLTVFTCVLRFLVKGGNFPPFVEGALSSANYAGSFLLMQLFGFTLATKQPSMTAAALAGSIREQRDSHQLDDLVTTIARICRSQLAAAIGNIAVVVPAAFAFDLLITQVYGRSYLDPETAHHTIESLHPLVTGTVPYAALTGVLLWASSLGAGWLENWAAYRRLPEALSEHRLGRFVGRGTMRWVGRSFAKHVAGLGGNVTLGVLLGSTAVLGKFFGLPLDVRHVTLSTGSLALALRALDLHVLAEPGTLWAMGGIVVIGCMNFGVSFMLALGVAFRAREVPTRHVARLGLAVLRRLFRSPLEFVFPPANAGNGGHAGAPASDAKPSPGT